MPPVVPLRPRIRRGIALAAVLLAVLSCFAFATHASAADKESIWGSSNPSRVALDPDRQAVEVGTRFTAQRDGHVTALRFYKLPGMTGRHAGTLWSGGGTRLASVTFGNESDSGWQVATLAEAVRVQRGASFVVSYSVPSGGKYAVTEDFRGASASPSLVVPSSNAGVFSYNQSFPTQTYRSSQYWVDVLFTPGVTASPTPSPSSTPTPSPTPTPSSTPTNPPSGGWPNGANTGWTGALGAYSGPCTITTNGYVIDSKDVLAKCSYLLIHATDVRITNSRLPRVDSTYRDGGSSVSIADSTVAAGAWVGGAVWGYNIDVARSEVTGGQHSVHANRNVTVTDSWLHSQYNPAGQSFHNNAFISNGGSNMTVRGNTLHCTAILNNTDGGCTADLSLFGDFGPISDVLVEDNLFKANNSSISYCAYGGYQPSKRYPIATGVRFVKNVFERGANGKCGVYGPVTSFQSSAVGNEWRGNQFTDGVVINPR